MTSNWALPQTIDQYAESQDHDISWNSDDNFQSIKTKNNKFLKTSRDLLHIARDPKSNIKEKTYFLRCRNFNLINVPDQISGIEIKLTSNRFGRITDDLIQLTLNDNLIGDNFADLDLTPIKVYGNNTDKWGVSITKDQILSNSFGVVLRFKSHPNWPHRSSMLIDSVELRIS